MNCITIEIMYLQLCKRKLTFEAFVLTNEALRCAYTILLMATYWMTEALPLPITSMIPMVIIRNSVSPVSPHIE